MKSRKTIGITIRFYTNDLGVTYLKKQVISCWDSGGINLVADKEKKIKSDCIQISCFEDIIPGIKKLLRNAQIYVTSDNQKPEVTNVKKSKKE